MVECRNCGMKRARKLNALLYVDADDTVYSIILCDSCLKEEEEFGDAKYHRSCVNVHSLKRKQKGGQNAGVGS